ncbi:MAG TPA: hypothetical protein VKV04_13330 [Verrucomicrobiae bacterium]|nr:hypothetical protein [Verrucomicrobiae bacterium]
MKPIHLFGVLLAASTLQAQTLNQATTNPSALPDPTPYTVVSQGANHQVWQSQTYNQAPNGKIVTNILQYTELATGLNHLVNGQWVASSEEIDIAPDGSSAWATNGQHRVYFPGDIYNGEIELVTPDGKTLQSQPIGLSYFDGTNSVLLAVVTNATGAILSSGNQVIYTNAFDGLNADLLYTYTKAGFEQDVVLNEQPPDPSSLGLNPATTRLQVLTEFFDPPQPNVTTMTVPTDAGDLENDILNFGVMQMGQGRAFLIGAGSPSVGVDKQWLELEGRQFLVEEVPIVSIASEIDSLPPYVAQAGVGTKPVVSRNLILPPQRQVHTSPKNTFVAKAMPPSRGFVLDYTTMTSQTNYTFHGDTTYYLSGTVNLSGTNTFEGGAVLKYASGASLNLVQTTITLLINTLTGDYRPVVFTAKDDNTVGDTISGSTGSPNNYYANPALEIEDSSVQTLSNIRIAYASQAILVSGNSAVTFYNGQLVNCQDGVTVADSPVYLRNVLFANVATNFNETSAGTVDVQNGTFNNIKYLSAESANNALTLDVTNCVLANVTNLFAGTYTNAASACTNGFYNCPAFGTGQLTNTSYPFQSVGAGNYYLTNGCNFLNQGMTNIDPVLLSSLAQLTTYPPAYAYSNTTVSTTTWTLQVQRDTNAAPALGYHYAPIDYAVSGVTVSGILTLSNDVAVASFQSYLSGTCASGFTVGSGDWLTSVGTALAHNQICHYAAVQEQPMLWGGNALKYAILVNASSFTSSAVLYARFTDFNGLAGLGTSAGFTGVSPTGVRIGGGDPMELNLRDCRVGPGWLVCATYQGTDTNVCINNLFDRGGIIISDFDGDSPVTMQNNLSHNGYVSFDNENQTYTWTVENNFFDNTALLPGSGGLSEDHNGYWNTTQLTPTNANDVVVTNFIYATGPLGNYYQVSTNLLNQGSTTAAALGLYHYTVQTNLVGSAEVAEGTNTVSIGFHYVAVDQYGNPLDSNGDGIPDYLEDANGDGVYDTGDLGDWQHLNLNVIITQPRNGSVFP